MQDYLKVQATLTNAIYEQNYICLHQTLIILLRIIYALNTNPLIHLSLILNDPI